MQWLTTGFAARQVPNNQGECREVRPAPMLRRSFRVEGNRVVYEVGSGRYRFRVADRP